MVRVALNKRKGEAATSASRRAIHQNQQSKSENQQWKKTGFLMKTRLVSLTMNILPAQKFKYVINDYA